MPELHGSLQVSPQLAGIARSELGAAVANIADQRSAIISALDLLVTGAKLNCDRL